MSKDAIARVRAAAAELAFKPSEIARALSSMSAGLVGIYVPDFHGAFFGPFLQTISHELRHCNRRMVVANGFGEGNPREQTLAGIEFLIERECDGILVFSNHLLDEDFGPIHAKQPRLAVVNRRVPAIEENCFYVDHHLGGALAAEALLAKGHRRFAVIAGPDSALDNLWRLDGFFAVLAEAGIARDEVRVVVSDFSFEGGWQAGTTLLDSKQPLTALFCANDEMAMGAMSCLQENGVRIPADVSVVGYDNTVMSAYTSPRLSTVSTPMCEMGVNACRWLINQCFGSDLPVSRDFAIGYVERASVGRPVAAERH